MPKRKFSRKFKISAARLVLAQGYSIHDAARYLRIDPANVRAWSMEFAQEARASDITDEAAMRAHIQRLTKENAKLEMECEILREAQAYFARQQLKAALGQKLNVDAD